MNYKSGQFFLFFLLLFCIQCCDSIKTHLEIKNLENSIWPANQRLFYKLKVDTQRPIDLLYQIQYHPDYPYQNIWLKYDLINPEGDTLIRSTDNLFLYDPGSGKPKGSGSKERLYETAYFLNDLKLKKGEYQLHVQHYMRTDSLRGIQAVGLKTVQSD